MESMIPVHLIAVGKMKSGPHKALFDDYKKRLTGKFDLSEMDARTTADEHKKIIEAIDPAKPLVLCDERGKTFNSRDMAAALSKIAETRGGPIQVVIGGADGLNDDIRARADLCLSFGTMVWPHMLVRVMLMEQLYRCQQILAGHPYHRD
jgi:23S rRNA (pseudouridine1915-N3)-methyltransferase